jgi:DNA-binding response OmpR family regulator
MTNSLELSKHTENLTILFAEDHKELRDNTTDILKNFFKTVHSVENGKDAIELYEKEPNLYDIVLSDIQMPYLNGVELTEKIYEINPEQAIIIISAHDESKYLLPLINLGIEQFVKKPLDYHNLLEVLLRTAQKISTKNSQEAELQVEIQLSKTITFNKENSSLNDKDTNIYITKYEMIFLQLLTTTVGKIYSNKEIVEYYASLEEDIDAHNIRKLVSKLRKKVPQDSIESIYGVGYKIMPYLDELSVENEA